QPNTKYEIALNAPPSVGFSNVGRRAAAPYVLSFQTSAAEPVFSLPRAIRAAGLPETESPIRTAPRAAIPVTPTARRARRRCQRPGREGRTFRPSQRHGHRRHVALGQMALGRDDPVQELAVVRQQQEPRSLLVEPPHGRDGRLPPPPALGQQVVDQRTRLLVRA